MAVIAFIVAFFAVSIWMALRARPLGDVPYRWATFLGVGSALSAPTILASAFLAFTGGHLFGGLVFVGVAALNIWTCVELLQRRRVGVVLFAVLWVMQTLSGPFVETTPRHRLLQTIKANQPSLSDLVIDAKFFLLYRVAVVTTAILAITMFIYFKKRWGLMDGHDLP
jgi:hypothetical protein